MSSYKVLPFVVGLLFGLLLIIALPFRFQKYFVSKSRSFETHNFENLLVADINNRGNQDIIACGGNYGSDPRLNGCSFYEFEKGKYLSIIGQTNIRNLADNKPATFTADYNNNRFHEVYMLGYEGNKLFLKGFEGPNMEKPFVNIYIDSFAFFRNVAYLNLSFFGQYDTDGDGYDEIFFSVKNSYPIYPRRMYRLNIKKKELIYGPSVGFSVSSTQVFDSTDDLYFTGSTGVTSNFSNRRDIPFYDSAGYAFVYDKDLNFVFEPIPLVSAPARCSNVILSDFLFTFWHNHFHKDAAIEKRDLKTGELIEKVMFYDVGNAQFSSIDNEGLIVKLNDTILLLDENLVELKRYVSNDIGELMKLTTRQPSSLVFLHSDQRTVAFLDNDFKHEQTVNIEVPIEKNLNTIHLDGETHFLVTGKDKRVWLLQHTYNSLFSYRWFYYLGVIGVSVVVSFFLFAIYRKRIELRWEQERELSELQYLSMKNQIDTHFMVNALTTIDWMYRNNKAEKASLVLGQLSRLAIKFLNSSSKIKTTLLNELKICRAYCEAKKNMDEAFNFIINIGDNIDPQVIHIPNQVIFTHVENAIKHAFPNNGQEKHLEINVLRSNGQLIVEIIDNGVGFKKNTASRGTQKGIQLTENIANLYQKLFGKNVHFTIGESKRGGTKVEVYWEE